MQGLSLSCGHRFHRVAINIPFSAVSLIQYTEGSHRAVEITLGGFFAARNILKCAIRMKGLMMKTIHNTKIIGIDHGYGNMKTANCCFPTGVLKSETEPVFTGDLLVWDGHYYSIGVGHKEFAPDKIKDEDYYVLTLAAIAKELKAENLTEAHIAIAAGLPLTWTSGQKADFRAYLMKNAEVEFTHIR